jgi:hypothetical protein
MTDLPACVDITEEGPREAFQIEPGPIPTADKVALIDALSGTGLRRIQVASFVSPRIVPGWADAEQVVAGFAPRTGVEYIALWFNAAGLKRAQAFADRLTLFGSITVTGSPTFTRRNLNRSPEEQIAAQRLNIAAHRAAGVETHRVSLQAAFGCNFSGEVSAAQALAALSDAMALAQDEGCDITNISLADSMGWATPARVERLVAEVRARFPNPPSRCTCTTRAAWASPARRKGCGWASRPSTRRWPGSAAAPSPASPARRATSPPRSWSSCARKWASRPAWTSKPCWRRRGWPSASWATHARPTSCAPASLARPGPARRRAAQCRILKEKRACRSGRWTTSSPCWARAAG